MNDHGELDDMISYIRNYVDNDVEPESDYDGKYHEISTYNNYNFDEVNAAVDIYKQELQSKIEKAEIFRLEIIKSTFRDQHKEYIINLLNDDKNEEVFDIMNRDCYYNNKDKPHEWDKDNIDLTFCYLQGIHDACRCEYCGGPTPVLCDSCEFYLSILRDN